MEELKRKADNLANKVEGLSGEVHNLGDRLGRTERNHRLLVVGLLLILGMGGVVAFSTWRSEQAIAEGEVVRQQVLCPVFALVVGGYDPESRPEGPARDAYIENHRIMRESYEQLRCTTQLVPPRTQ